MIVPVAVLLLGYAESLKLLVVVWVVIWPILMNTASAASLLDELLIDVARTFRLDRMTTLGKIILPAVVPDFLLGLRVAMPLGDHHHIAGGNAHQPAGRRQPDRHRPAPISLRRSYGLLIVVGLMGFLLNSLFAVIEQLILRRWPPRMLDMR